MRSADSDLGTEKSKRSSITRANLPPILLISSCISGSYIPTELPWTVLDIESNGTRTISGW